MSGESSPTRRKVLQSVVILPLAGCLSENGDSGQAGIGKLILANETDSFVALTVQVNQDGDVVYEAEHELEPGQISSPDKTWTTTGEYEITASATVGNQTLRATGPVVGNSPDEMIPCIEIEVGNNEIDILQPTAEDPSCDEA